MGVEYTFPSIDLMADNYLLLAKDSVAFKGTFGVDAYQWTAGALSNGGEPVELSDNFANVVDYVPFEDQFPWDSLADGQGPSLTLCNPDSDNELPENWTASVNFVAVNSAGDSIFATPGFACQVSILAAFEGNPTWLPVDDSVMFTDLTVGNPTEWTWTFEGGAPDTWSGQTPPYIVYNAAGDWDVTLAVSDGVNSDTVTLEDYIHVGIPPTAGFEADQTVVTAGSYTNFTSLSTGDDLTFEWFFEGGTPETSTDENPSEIYYLIMEWTTYDVTLIVENPFGSDSLTMEDYIEVVPESVRELTLNSENVKIYPNPNNGQFTLSMPAGIEASLEVLDMKGVSVYKKDLNGPETIDPNGLEQGIYILRIVDQHADNLVVKRLIVK
jgi:hypothetical protein